MANSTRSATTKATTLSRIRTSTTSSASQMGSEDALNEKRATIRSIQNIDKVTLGPGVTLEGTELEDFCRKRGLCPLCGKVRTRKRVFKLFQKNKWEPLTVTSKEGNGFSVYKGYCVAPNCFTLEQAKTLAGEKKSANIVNSRRRSNRRSLNNSCHSRQAQQQSPETHQRKQQTKSRTRCVFKGSAALTGTTTMESAIGDDINDMDSATGGSDVVGRAGTTTTFNSKTHRTHPKAFPPPELKSISAFELHDHKPFVLVEQSALALKEDSITVLDLSNLSQLRQIDYQAISNALQVNTTLQSLIFENCGLKDEFVNIIGEGLHEAKDLPLAKLYLRSNTLSDEAIDALCPFLEANTTLEKIDVSRNKITSRGGVAIFNAFQRNRLTRIRCINLAHNELWNLTEGKFGIQSFLARNRTIQVLNLEANYINDDGCEAITRGLIDNDQTCLERLYLGWNSIGDDGMIALSHLLESNTSLEVLGVGENQIKNAGARSLLQAMDYNTTITEISGLWTNRIERRFIIVAIRRLLLSPNRGLVAVVDSGGIDNITERSMQDPVFIQPARASRSSISRTKRDNHIEEQAPSSTIIDSSTARDVETITSGGMASQQNSLENMNYDPSNHSEHNEDHAPIAVVPSTAAVQQQQQQQEEEQDVMTQIHDSVTKISGGSVKSIISAKSSKSMSSSSTSRQNQLPDIGHSTTATTTSSTTSTMNGSASNSLLVSVGEQQQQQVQQSGCFGAYEGGVNSEDVVPYDCLTVYQSVPLAYFDRETGIHKAIPLFDYEGEITTIKEAVREAFGARIDVISGIPDLEGFTQFFSTSSHRDDATAGNGRRHVMHFTSYGGHNSDHQIELENGYGSIHTLPVDGLRRLIIEGFNEGNNRSLAGSSAEISGAALRVVFVSSCHSRAIGQAFVDAGVPHVICCQREKRYNDEVVTEFTRKFYRALADNKLLQHSFNIAVKAVNSSGCAKRSRRVTERFCLLPEPNDKTRYVHEVPVFFTQAMTPPEESPTDKAANTLHFPKTPQNFLGREVDMYEILEALRVDDVVKVLSPPGHGKDSAVAAVCEYAMRRKKIFSVDDIFWVPPPDGVIPQEDSLYGDLCLTVNIIKNSQYDIWEKDEVLLECRERIEIELEELQVVLVIDDRDFKFKGSQEGLEKFVSYLLNCANAKVIIITSKKSSELASTQSTLSTSPSESRIEESNIEIGPLDFKSTARLFGENSRYIASNGCPAAHSGIEFAELLEPTFISKMPDPSSVISQRRSELLLRMGNGLPARVIRSAADMSKEDFIELIGIANRPEVFVDSLGALEKELEFRKLEREKAIKEGNNMRAMDLDIILEEIECMRPEFPTLDDLIEEETLMKEDLAGAVKNRHYNTANDLKRELLALKKKIMKEQRLTPDNAKDANDRVNALQAQVQSMIEGAELTHVVDTDVKSATFAVHCDGRDCSFVIYPGEVYDFEHPSEAMGMVCWGNESCELQGTDFGVKLLERGGDLLKDELSKLPIKVSSPYGPVRCVTGNALILGPAKFGDIEAPCVILSVGPLSPSDSQVDAIDDDTDSLHHITMMLRSCYRSSMVLARHAELQALAISLLTTRKEGQAYAHTLRLGLQTLIEEVKFTHLRDLHIAASSHREASILIAMMSEMGYRQIRS